MIPLEKQVCNLELSKRLKELGVKQESLWSWWIATDRDDTPALNRSSQKNCPTCGHPSAPYFGEIAAFTVAELDDLLKTYLHKIIYLETTEEWVVYPIIKVPPQTAEKGADARAKMLIYLVEQKLVTL
jgi:hypothetical protein